MDKVIFIPCYNAGLTIGETVDSVIVSLNNYGVDVPIYIYDDCSAEFTKVELERLCIKYPCINVIYLERNLGQWALLNYAMRKLIEKFNWLLLIHADDICKDNWVDRIMSLIDNSDDETFSVWSSYDVLIDSSGEVIPGESDGYMFSNKKELNLSSYNVSQKILSQVYTSWHISGCALNLSICDKIGDFDQQFPHFGDTDYFVRAAYLKKNYIYSAESLIFYRIHGNSESSKTFSTNRDVNEMFHLLIKHINKVNLIVLFRVYVKIINLTSRRLVKSILYLKVTSIFFNCMVVIKMMKVLILLNIEKIKLSKK